MDKILEFINKKTNNKYNYLLFFEAILYSKTNTMQIIFKKTEKTVVNTEITEELQVLCKQFLGDLVDNVTIVIKNDNLTLAQFKELIKNIISSNEQLNGVDFNNVTFDFDKDSDSISIPLITSNQNLNEIKLSLEEDILTQTGKNVCINFVTNLSNEDVLQYRKEKLYEDNKVFEVMKNSNLIDFEVTENIYGKIEGKKGLLAGADIEVGNVTLIGNVKSFTEKIKATKSAKENDEKEESSSKYYILEIEYEGSVTKSILFLKKGEETPIIKVEDSIVIDANVNSFNGYKNIRIKNIAKCKYEPPKKVWRSLPSTYRFVKPEPYIAFEQGNFFTVEEETKCKYLKDNVFVVYDLETTGISPDTNDIIDIGAFKIVNGKITEKFSSFVNPLREIPEAASKINRITNSMVEDSPTIEQVLPDFYKFCDGAIIIGYNNIDFDDLYIQKAGKKYLYNFNHTRDDVKLLAQKYIKGIKNYKLGTVCAEMNVPLIDAHRATNDALATAKLFIKIAEKFM